MADATCKTCPFWERLEAHPDGTAERKGYCHHSHSEADDNPQRYENWWCSEHPLRQRDRLAAMAMQGILASVGHFCDEDSRRAGYPDREVIAVNAYEIADAMLAEAAKGPARA